MKPAIHLYSWFHRNKELVLPLGLGHMTFLIKVSFSILLRPSKQRHSLVLPRKNKGIINPHYSTGASPMAQQVKNPPVTLETQEMPIRSLSQENPLEKDMATHSSILAWKKPHGQRSLVGYNPKGCKELDVTEWLSMHKYSFPTHNILYVKHFIKYKVLHKW